MKNPKKLLDRFSKRDTVNKTLNFLIPERKSPISELYDTIDRNADNDNTSNYLKICFHYFYKHWIRYQHIFGILVYTGFSNDSPFWVVPFIWGLLYVAYNRLRFHTLRFGARLHYFIFRFIYFAGITAIQALIFTPFVYVFLPNHARQNLVQLIVEIWQSLVG